MHGTARLVRSLRVTALGGLLVLVFLVGRVPSRVAAVAAVPSAPAPSYGTIGAQAARTLVGSFYGGSGLWRDCVASDCRLHNNDWGSDSLTDSLYLRWKTAPDPAARDVLAALAGSTRRYPAPCFGRACLLWSDAPLWDSIADEREYEADPKDVVALEKALAAFRAVELSDVYERGACPAIRYQRPFGRGDKLKTLETDSNGVKSALLLYDATRDPSFLRIAERRYAAIRKYFLDPELPLYSVYVFDDGHDCVQVPHRFFASVNGNMIWNGLRLATITGDPSYRAQARATEHAVMGSLSDQHGVFTDLQAENDIAEPLIEAMYVLADGWHDGDARRWLLANAAAAYAARKPDGTFGRFFDGPPPPGAVSAWQTNGGFALEIAAAALAPEKTVARDGWERARLVSREIKRFPARVSFEGSGIALLGTIGDVCCQPGHARVMLDGVETTSHVGAWQNKSSSGRRLPDSVIFAWRWASIGHHEVTLLPGDANAKEGGAFVHLSGYLVR